MRKTRVLKFVDWSDGTLFLGNEDAIIYGVSIDSRNISKGDAFFAIKGENFDGHNFIYNAIKAGAATVVASDCEILTNEIKKYRKSQKNDAEIVQNPFINVILVDDTLHALQKIAKGYLKSLNIKVVAVTGSVGKTTVKDMIAGICESKYHTAKTIGNYNNEIGLPLTILSMEENTELAVLEMGMNHRGEIRKLADIARPNIAVITNIGVSHIENLGSREEICAEKMDVASFFDEDCVLVVNGEDDLLSKPQERITYRKILVGEQGKVKEADVVISHIKTEGEITSFRVSAAALQPLGGECSRSGGEQSETADVRLPRAGRHNALNAALALGCAKCLGISPVAAAAALGQAKYTGRRLEFKLSARGFTVIDDSYNASPDSMRAALTVLSDAPGVRRIAVLADMLEMGEESHRYHWKVGEFMKDLNIDLLLTYGQAAKYIAKACNENNGKVKISEYTDKSLLINELKSIIKEGDVVLVKGSNSMKMNEISDHILN